jgi:hypothetical protein
MTNLRTALLTIRAWVERGSSSPLRAKVRLTNDVANGFEKTAIVTSPEAGAEIVKDWLEDMIAADQPPDDLHGLRDETKTVRAPR